MGKSTINGHFQLLFVSLPEGIIMWQLLMDHSLQTLQPAAACISSSTTQSLMVGVDQSNIPKVAEKTHTHEHPGAGKNTAS